MSKNLNNFVTMLCEADIQHSIVYHEDHNTTEVIIDYTKDGSSYCVFEFDENKKFINIYWN